MSAEATRKQDLASEFSKKFRGDNPDPHSGRGRPLPALTPSPAFGRARGASTPVLGPKRWSSLNFSVVVAPLPTKVFDTATDTTTQYRTADLRNIQRRYLNENKLQQTYKY